MWRCVWKWRYAGVLWYVWVEVLVHKSIKCVCVCVCACALSNLEWAVRKKAPLKVGSWDWSWGKVIREEGTERAEELGGDWRGPGEREAAFWADVWETKWARPPIWSFRQKEGVWIFYLILLRSPWNFYKKLCWEKIDIQQSAHI